MTKKTFRQLHLWLSLPFGLIISAICFSGAMLVFEKEITETIYHNLYFVEPSDSQPLPLDRLISLAQKELTGEGEIVGVTISSDTGRAYQMNLSQPHRAAIFVNQYTGEVLGQAGRISFFQKMAHLHRALLVSMKSEGGKVANLIVGISTLLFVFILITGVIVWFPRSWRACGKSLKIVAGKGWRRFWYSLHIAGGMYATCFLLVMALTGLTWVFPWFHKGVFAVLAPSEKKEQSHHSGGEGRKKGKGKTDEKEKTTDFAQWQKVFATLSLEHNQYHQIRINDGSARISYGGLGNQRAGDRYTFDPQSGTILEESLYQDQEKASKLSGWFMSLHVGSWGGLITRILSFLAAFLGFVLPLTGYYMWIVRKLPSWRKRRSAPKVA